MAQSGDNINSKADHLCILVHGLWGSPIHLANVVKVLREKHSEEELVILVAKRNTGSFTYDGVETGGERLCQEIEEEIATLEKNGQTIKKISLIGYSLGGLIARYAIGLLDSRGLFDKVEPINFTTFATPHLGIRTPLRGWHNHIWNVLGARLLSMSGRQLFTIDNFRGTDRPLLAILADSNSIFVKGLAKFKRRSLYANIVNDRSAVYYTTGVSRIDPFTNLDKVKINYCEGYEDVVMDPKQPVSLIKEKPAELTPYSRFVHNGGAIINSLPLMLAVIVFIPFGVVAFLLNAAVQTVTSNRRIRLHEAGQGGIAVHSYRVPFLVGMREAVEDVYENLNSAQSNEYLTSGSGEEQENGIPASFDEKCPNSADLTNESARLLEKDDSALTHEPHHDDFPTLALSADQFSMIQGLDSLAWNKYPVYIHKVRHSHAAMIVRMNRTSFDEGWVVLRHWVTEEFRME